MIDIKINFSKWFELDDYLENCPVEIRSSGVYIISLKSPKNVSNRKASCTDKDIIYIGMSSTSLRYRIKSFCWTIKGKKENHSGAQRIRKLLGKYDIRKYKNKKIYVSYFIPTGHIHNPLRPSDYKTMGITSYFEFLIIGKFFKKFNQTPIGNANKRNGA